MNIFLEFYHKIKTLLLSIQKCILWKLIPLYIVCCFSNTGLASQTINVEKLASAIRRAEGNANYGILKPIRGRNYRKACIQTINHALKDYQGSPPGFISFLGSRYAPINAKNDPHHLNENWVSNVTSIYNNESMRRLQ